MVPRTTAACTFILASTLFSAPTAQASERLSLEARLGHPVMKGGEVQRNFLRIGLHDCKADPAANRTPVNVALVIDRSGSMSGERIAQAREAAIMAINRLNENDIASVIIFDERIEVLVPAQNVTDKRLFIDSIGQATARGQTAIHAGVREGASEVRKFKDARRLNRIVLLSDGLANVGPRSPAEFAVLGRELQREDISVSTIGLGHGYNEDLMLALARASDGNHAFASAPADLIQIFNKEFDDVLTSCAQMVSVDVELAPGVRAVRALSRDGRIDGQRVSFRLNQVYRATEHYILLELELAGKPSPTEQDLGRVRVEYTVPDTGAKQAIDAAIRGRFTQSGDEMKASADKTVLEAVLEQTTRERAQLAVQLRDQGKTKEAANLLEQNEAELRTYLTTAGKPSAVLRELEHQYGSLARSLVAAPPSQWTVQRKLMRQLEAKPAGSATRY
jgi:Ca-activated chloride channel family protein